MSQTKMPDLSVQEIVAIVERRLAPYRSARHVLEVLPDVAHKEGNWWYVVVSHGQTDVSAADYIARVEKVERDLKRLDGINAVLLPVVPDWMAEPK